MFFCTPNGSRHSKSERGHTGTKRKCLIVANHRWRPYTQFMEDLIAWAGRVDLRPITPGRDDIVHLANKNVAFSIASHHDVFPVEFATEGRARGVLGVFETQDDARRFLMIECGALLRARRRMPRLRASALPPGFVIEEAPTALWLSWFTGSAEFPPCESARRRAFNFSIVERAPLDQISSSFLEPTGRPLYAVG